MVTDETSDHLFVSVIRALSLAERNFSIVYTCSYAYSRLRTFMCMWDFILCLFEFVDQYKIRAACMCDYCSCVYDFCTRNSITLSMCQSLLVNLKQKFFFYFNIYSGFFFLLLYNRKNFIFKLFIILLLIKTSY